LIRKGTARLDKKQLATVITAGVLALLIIAYVIINAVIAGSDGSSGGNAGTGEVTYDESIGESLYLGKATVYPYIAKASMLSVTVGSEIDTFTMQKARDGEGKLLSYFLFYYMDDEGRARAYMPPITSAENSFDYTDFYSVETSDGLGATKIDYLCAALGALYYDYKVPLKEDTAAREAQLKLYGLDTESREVIAIRYLDGEGKEQQRTVYVGDKLINGVGYYFMLEGREIVYAGSSSDRLSYALGGFEKFLHSRLIAESLPTDGVASAYMPTDYKQWDYVYRDVKRDERGEPVLDENGKEIPFAVTEGSTAIIRADYLTPIYYNADKPSGYSGGGYIRDGYSSMNVDLSVISSRPAFSRMVEALVGRTVEREDTGKSDTVVTVVDGMNAAVLKNGEKGKYEYTILGIESVLDSKTEIFTEGTPVLGYDLVKVAYTYTLDGERPFDGTSYAVIDLTDERALPAAARDAIVASSVGTLAVPISFGVYYTEDNAAARTVTYVITKVNGIFKLGENDYTVLDSVTSDAVVSIEYHTVVTGVDGTAEVSETTSRQIDLSAIGEDSDPSNLKIKNALVGAVAGDTEISVTLGTVYYQLMQSFTSYSIERVEGFVERELTVSFRFANESERDPFYRESSYLNTIGEVEADNPFRIYPLNVDNCDKVMRIVSGISKGTSSQVAEGLVGSETVAVGLTPAVMREYGLYDGHTIYVEFPRNIGEDAEDSGDYAWSGTLGFTLYISDPNEDGTRYVGSDMYDIVVKMSADTFDFVERSFAEFWGRRNLVMIGTSDINRIELDLSLSDVVGSYNFDLEHRVETSPDGTSTRKAYDAIVTIDGFDGSAELEGVYGKTALSSLLASLGREKITVADLYSRLAGLKPGEGGLMEGNEPFGTAMFNEQLFVLFYTFYNGILTEEEQTEALSGKRLMSLSFDVNKSSSSLSYVYDFYRVDEERILVSFYTRDESGARSTAVNDFYLSNFSFKKIVANYINILNGQRVDADVPYPDTDIDKNN